MPSITLVFAFVCLWQILAFFGAIILLSEPGFVLYRLHRCGLMRRRKGKGKDEAAVKGKGTCKKVSTTRRRQEIIAKKRKATNPPEGAKGVTGVTLNKVSAGGGGGAGASGGDGDGSGIGAAGGNRLFNNLATGVDQKYACGGGGSGVNPGCDKAGTGGSLTQNARGGAAQSGSGGGGGGDDDPGFWWCGRERAGCIALQHNLPRLGERKVR
eukprot:g72091.t1